MLPSHKQVWCVVTATVMVAGLTHYALADVIVFTGNVTVTVFPARPASFGPLLPLEGFKGLAVAVTPSDACVVPSSPPSPVTSKYFGPWIAVVARYNCSFTDKVLNAQEAGYSAVIVYNIGSDDLLRMGFNDSTKALEVDIPSVFIGASDGHMITNHFVYKKGHIKFTLELTDDLPFNLANYLVPFAITIGICSIVMLSFMVVKCVRDYRHSRRHRLSSRSLKKLPLHKFKKGDHYECCAICLEDYVDNDKLRILPCEHAYHSKCIDPWLTKNRRVCPVCKRKVFTGDERPSDLETDSEDETSPLVNSGGGTQGGTFDNQRVNPFTEALRQAQDQRRNRLRRVSRHVECGPEGYQRLAESSSSEEEPEDEEEGEQQEKRTEEDERVAGSTTGHTTSGEGDNTMESDPTVTVVVHDGATQSETFAGPSRLMSCSTSGPVQIAVDVVNSSDQTPTSTTITTTGEQMPSQHSSSGARSDHDYVV